jgi:hypothetical protein
LLIVAGLLSVLPNSANADYLSVAVTVTCDHLSNRALVRFGYGDDADNPKFASIADENYRALSIAPPELPGGFEQDEATCVLPDGREVRARKGYGPVFQNGTWLNLPFSRFSVWVGKVPIIHAEGLNNNDQGFPFGISVGPEGFRMCRYRLADDESVYDLTNDAEHAQPVPIECDGSPSTIGGPIDEVEYPPSGSRAPPLAGTLHAIRLSDDGGICDALIKRSRFGDRIDAEAAKAPADGDWTDTDHKLLQEAQFDIFSSGTPRKVFRYIIMDRANDLLVLIVPPLQANDADVEAFLKSSHDRPWENTNPSWIVFSAIQTPYKQVKNFHLYTLLLQRKYYVLAVPSPNVFGSPKGARWAAPAAVLLQPRPDGVLKTLCSFQSIDPHF